MSIYYNLTVINFQENCTKLIQKSQYISECFYSLYDCCRSAIKEKIEHFDKCENNVEYLCSYTMKKIQPENLTIIMLYGMVGGVVFWMLVSICKIFCRKKCQKKQEFGFDDLEDETELLE